MAIAAVLAFTAALHNNWLAHPATLAPTKSGKDEDELALAVRQRRFDAVAARAIEGEAAAAEAIVAAWG